MVPLAHAIRSDSVALAAPTAAAGGGGAGATAAAAAAAAKEIEKISQTRKRTSERKTGKVQRAKGGYRRKTHIRETGSLQRSFAKVRNEETQAAKRQQQKTDQRCCNKPLLLQWYTNAS